MKRLLVFVCFVVLAVACTPVSNENTANANKGTETKTMAPPTVDDISAKEKAAWDGFKRKDEAAFKKYLLPDYFGVTNNGVSDTAQSLTGMKDTELSDVTFGDWKLTTIDKDAVLLTYTATVKATYKGKALPDGPYYEASAYVNRNGEWLNIYYQETLEQKMPMASASPAPAKPAASAMAAKPAETTDDVSANEKLVWESIKGRNYDAFGSYLADNSIEIEMDGVRDKAGSIKDVQGFDASKAELSDWKTVKFDDDASVVTYKVKIPGDKPTDTSYHSTIWVKRDGKWHAFFHMGTPAQDLTTLAGSKPGASPEMKASPTMKASPEMKPSPKKPM